MRRGAIVGAVGLSLLFGGTVLANGFGGDTPPARIPIPARDFSGTVEDLSGTRIAVTQVSYNGEVFLYGYLGDGQVTVPFESIREVRFEPSNDEGKRVAFVQLRAGDSVSLVVDDDILAYGKTSFGTYSITVDKIRKIELDAPPPPEGSP